MAMELHLLVILLNAETAMDWGASLERIVRIVSMVERMRLRVALSAVVEARFAVSATELEKNSCLLAARLILKDCKNVNNIKRPPTQPL